MKKAMAVAAILAAIISGQIDLYPETAVVTEIENHIVTVETFTGNQFQFDEEDEWCEGDIVSMIMYGNETDNVEDDEIVTVRYSGYIN